MPLSKEHKNQTRARIVDAAARLFRERGYDGVGIDTIMAEAGLTRGGFYAHFSSKEALFNEVLSTQHDLARRMAARTERPDISLLAQAAAILDGYLSPENFASVSRSCTFATLSGDAARTSPGSRQAMTKSIRTFRDEMCRGHDGCAPDESWPLAILAQSVGALVLARAVDDPALSTEILEAARSTIRAQLAD